MENLELWNKYKDPPDWAKKRIKGGRLSGMTDINPVWRLHVLTQEFGAIGFGWNYKIEKMWSEPACHGCILAFVKISLKVKVGDDWSDGVTGIGGSQMVQLESAGLRANDECYKMALTDALGVACKELGIGSEVYKGEKSKYDNQQTNKPKPANNNTDNEKPWLNEIDKQTGDLTKEFLQVKGAIENGLRTAKDARNKYRISKMLYNKLEQLEVKK